LRRQYPWSSVAFFFRSSEALILNSKAVPVIEEIAIEAMMNVLKINLICDYPLFTE
jgi:hypothetical protein